MKKVKLFVITGGPGVGKTTVLNALEKQGFLIVKEEARRIIQEQIQTDGEALPWKNKALYSKLMLEASFKTYQRIIGEISSDIVFFDRGILDTVCYMNMENIAVSEEISNLINDHLYNRKVFILPPWQEIYSTDSERKQTWEEAVYTFDKMKQTYLAYGYECIEVPKASVVERCSFMLDHII